MADTPDLSLTTEYRGARLVLTYRANGTAALTINGIERQAAALSSGETAHLSSTVQTDYEWHEFIEGIVRPVAGGIEAVLLANKAEIAREAFQTPTDA